MAHISTESVKCRDKSLCMLSVVNCLLTGRMSSAQFEKAGKAGDGPAARLAAPGPSCLPGYGCHSWCSSTAQHSPAAAARRPSVRPNYSTDRPTDRLTDWPTDRPTVRPSVRSTDRPRMTSLTAQLYSHTLPPVISCSLRLSWSRSSLERTLSFSLFASPWWSPPSPSLSQFLSLSPPSLSLPLSSLTLPIGQRTVTGVRHIPIVLESAPSAAVVCLRHSRLWRSVRPPGDRCAAHAPETEHPVAVMAENPPPAPDRWPEGRMTANSRPRTGPPDQATWKTPNTVSCPKSLNKNSIFDRF